jgi:hypothetical protein
LRIGPIPTGYRIQEERYAMTTQSPPAAGLSRPVRHRSLRSTTAIAAAAALIATGAYVATTTTGSHPAPPAPEISRDVAPSAQVIRELRDSVAGQYGSRPAAGAPVNPSAQTRRDLHQSIAGQYGPAR